LSGFFLFSSFNKKSMKKFSCLIMIIALGLLAHQQVQAQGFLDKLKQKVKDKTNQRIDQNENKAVDKALDQVDPSKQPARSGSSGGSNNASGPSNNTAGAHAQATSYNESGQPTGQQGMKIYKNYDFVPGDKIIFESQLKDEQIGEIPSQFELATGQMDVQVEDGEKVLHVPKGPGAYFKPRITSASYLPDQFTIEFDIKNELFGLNHIHFRFGEGLHQIDFDNHSVDWSTGGIEFPETLHTDGKYPNQWHHVAIAVNKNAGKVYVDEYRVANVNNLSGNAGNVTLIVNGYENSWIKNLRIAAGGIDIYKKVSTDGKIVTHGITFDIDKSSIKPESMGTLNSIYKLMQSDPSLKFEIDGHTDNSGTAAHNLTLSQDRANAVKEQLVSMGIDASRLTAKGFGDTKPLSDNNSPEGRANNRRVEFVKI
jgi:OmpA-OmpF porin, OOP family